MQISWHSHQQESTLVKATDISIWGIHAGKTGDADNLFLKKGCVALGWAKMADLAALKPDRDAFKTRLVEVYPEKKPGAIPNNAGQLFRFVHEMKPGDIIVYPSKHDRQVHLGRVEGPYTYDPAKDTGYPNSRSVKWARAVPRTRFSQGALYEIGSAMSLFQGKNYVDEFRVALEGAAAAAPVTQDDTVAFVAEDIEETPRDFVPKSLAPELNC